MCSNQCLFLNTSYFSFASFIVKDILDVKSKDLDAHPRKIATRYFSRQCSQVFLIFMTLFNRKSSHNSSKMTLGFYVNKSYQPIET